MDSDTLGESAFSRRRTMAMVAVAPMAFVGAARAQPGASGRARDGRDGAVYVVTNDPVPGGNAILGYRNDGRGNLQPLPGSPFPTGGAGFAKTKGPLPHFGPFDSDQNIVVTADRRRLFATNGGSDTIAVFDIQDDATLRPVVGSPFASGGYNPVSIGLAGNRLYVVNKNDDPSRDLSASLPNYAGFQVAANGALAPIAGSVLALETPWRSPTQALVVADRFIFDGDFGSFFLPARVEQWGERLRADTPSAIRSLRIDADGRLTQLPPLQAPPGSFVGGLDTDKDGKPDALMFGLAAHPRERLIYISFVTASRLGVYAYDEQGRLDFVGAVPNSGGLICWILVNGSGTRAYTANNASDTLSIYDLANPRAPREIRAVDLKGHGHPYQLAVDRNETFLYVVKHRIVDETPVGDGSVLNVLRLAPDGDAREVGASPVTLPVRDDLLARPQGVVAL